MKNSMNAYFIPAHEYWDIEVKHNESHARIFLKKDHTCLVNTFDDEKEQTFVAKREEMKKYPAFNGAIEKIEHWEEEMTEDLEISEVNLLTTEKNFFIYSFKIISPVSYGHYNLKETKKETLEQFSSVSKGFQYLLALEKKIVDDSIYLCANDDYPMRKAYLFEYLALRSSQNVLEELHKLKREIKNTRGDYYTHRTFVEDVVKKINEAPSVRIKKLMT